VSPIPIRALVGAAALLNWAPGTEAAAQRVVHGVLFDSLRTERPIPGAQVEVDGGRLVVRTDSGGRFTVVLPRLQHAVLAYRAPWLDSLGFDGVETTVSAGAGRSDTVFVTLSTPGWSSYQVDACGSALTDTLAVLVGEVRDRDAAPPAGIEVVARWWEARLVAGRPQVQWLQLADTTREDGTYVLCGVPLGADVALRAEDRSRRSGVRSLSPTARIHRHDLTVAGAGAVTQIRGRVLAADGAPVAGAVVTLRDDPSRTTRTSTDGRFALPNIPAASGEVVVQQIGFAPVIVAFDPTGAITTMPDAELGRAVTRLAEVRVEADRYERARLEFERRRRGAVGAFLTDSVLALFPRVTVGAVVSLAPRLSILNSPLAPPPVRLQRGAGRCPPRFFVDGQDVGRLDTVLDLGEQEALIQRAKRMEVYSAAQAPPEFNDFDGCGAVVIWTR
jgi:hypothetical protein